MKVQIAIAAVAFSCAFAMAQESTTRKPCEDLKTEIAKKLDAKGVVGYSLDVVDKGKGSAETKVVGSCDGGTKDIVYSRGTAQPKPADEKKPQ